MKRKSTAVLALVVLAISAYAGGLFGGKDIQTFTVTGSTTVLPLVQKAAEKYMDHHSTVNIQIAGGGSGVGVQSVGEGTAAIGMSSRDMKDAEKKRYPNLNPIAIAKDGIALVVHPTNPVNSLTLEEVKKIYEGTYMNWSQLGGEDKEIVVIGRDSASGTREFFWTRVMKKGDFVNTMLEKNSNGAVKQTVSQTPGAIGYIGLGYLDGTVKPLTIKINDQEVTPTSENVRSGLYPISRSLYLIVRGNPEGLVQDFINFMLSSEGQKIVEEEGFVPLTSPFLNAFSYKGRS